MRYKTAAITGTGNVRKNNEDSLLLCRRDFGGQEALLAAVADGMGGLSHGERASRYAVDCLRQWWEETVLPMQTEPELGKLNDTLGFVLEKIQMELKREAEQLHANMGTTLSLVFLWKEEYVIKQIGDSRIYLLDGKRHYQLTKDQTWCQREIDAGRLKPEEALTHPKRHMLLNALGLGESFFVESREGQLRKKQRLLLCSDGYYHYMNGEELRPKRFGDSPEKALKRSEERIKKGEADDNYTAILIGL